MTPESIFRQTETGDRDPTQVTFIHRHKFLYGPREVGRVGIPSLEIEECLIDQYRPGLNKILWCLYPFEQIEVNHVANPFAHTDTPYRSSNDNLWRKRVCEAFDTHHKVGLTEAEQWLIIERLEASLKDELIGQVSNRLNELKALEN